MQEEIKLLTIKDVQRILKVSRKTVYNLIEKKAFTMKKIGHSSRIIKTEIDNYINSCN